MTLLALNYDVLVGVSSYLHGRDALNFALAAKATYAAAIPRVPAIIDCYSSSRLWMLWHHVVDPSSDNPRRIRSLAISPHVVEPPPLQFTSSMLRTQYAEITTDILQAARNITKLTIGLTAILHDARAQPVIASLPRLVHLDLCQFSADGLSLISNLSGPLRTLHINYYGALVRTPPHLDALFAAALSNRKLQALSVITPYLSRPCTSKSFLPPHSSLRRLILTGPGSLPEEVIQACFRLEAFGGDAISSFPSDHDFLPPLKHLCVSDMDLHHLVNKNRLKSVRFLDLIDPSDVGFVVSYTQLARALRVIRPLGLFLPVSSEIENGTWAIPFRDISPTLRCLALSLDPPFSMNGPPEVFTQWLADLPMTLRFLPVVCLRLHIPAIFQSAFDAYRRIHAGSASTPRAHTRTHMDTTATAASTTPSTSRSEHPCAPVVAAFPQRFAEVLPALRYFAFSVTRPLPLQHCRDPLYSTHHDLYWWRVRPGCSPDKAPVVEPITGAEGNRVWCAVLDAATQEDVAEVLRRGAL